jgi:hypothetical protein
MQIIRLPNCIVEFITFLTKAETKAMHEGYVNATQSGSGKRRSEKNRMLSKKMRVLSLLGLISTNTIIVLADLNPISSPPDPSKLRPVERIPREKFGVVGNFPLTEKDLHALVYPSTSPDERNTALPGLTFFTTPHTAAEGAGPIANQPMCLGCHMNSNEAFGVDKNGNYLRAFHRYLVRHAQRQQISTS